MCWLRQANLGHRRDPHAPLQAAADHLVLGGLSDGHSFQQPAPAQAGGISALQLQRQLDLGSYKTAWLLCAKLRRSMVAPGRIALAGRVEVDETEIACRSKYDPLTGGGRSHQGKMLVVGAVEIEDGGAGPGRIRLAEVPDYSADSLHPFIAGNLAPGATAKTDGWSAYPGAPSVKHDPHVVGKMAAHIVLPWVHRIFSNLKILIDCGDEFEMLRAFARDKRIGPYTYVYLVENVRENGRTKQRIVANLGRKEVVVARGDLDRLARSVARLAQRSMVLSLVEDEAAPDARCRRIGPALLFERLWHEVGCRAVLAELAADRQFEFAAERAVFLTVLHRLFVSGSDRAAEKWRADYRIDGTEALQLHHLYRAGLGAGCLPGLAPQASAVLSRRVRLPLQPPPYAARRLPLATRHRRQPLTPHLPNVDLTISKAISLLHDMMESLNG